MITKRRTLIPAVGESANVVRLYDNDGDFLYAGVAPEGSLTSEPVWRITKIDITDVSTTVFENAVWDERI